MIASALLHGTGAALWGAWPSPSVPSEPSLVVELVLLAPTATTPVMAVAPVSAPARPPPVKAAPVQSRPQPLSAPVRAVVPSRRMPAPGPVDFEAGAAGAAVSPKAEARGVVGSTWEGAGAIGAAQAGPTRGAGYDLGSSATPLPPYPWSARRRGREGRVVIRLDVDHLGRPVAVAVAESSGEPALDHAACDTLWQWRLQPALQDGVAVKGTLLVPIRFELHSPG